MKDIVELNIKNKEDFDNHIWNYETDFGKEEYQASIKTMENTLVEIMNSNYCDELEDLIGSGNFYILGDISNMLQIINVEVNQNEKSN